MSKFNTKQKDKSIKTVNFAGGKAFSMDSKQKLISMLWSSFLSDSHYETENDKIKRFQEALAEETDKKFIAKLALYTRNTLGMRSTSHLAAIEIAKSVKGEEWTKRFFNSIIYRVDDMSEIIAGYKKSEKDKSLPHSLIKGFKKAFNRFNDYQLAKYQGKEKNWSLLDVVNMVRPKPNNKNKTALNHLIKNGKVINTETWESKLSLAGASCKNDEEKKIAKKEAWKDLITNNKLGYFALLRNLRNILLQAPECIPDVCKLLINEESIKKSLVLPFRYLSAYNEVLKLEGIDDIQEVIKHLSWALDICLSNMPKFEGKTLVAIDSSGSMSCFANSKSSIRIQQIAALFGASFAKSNKQADIILFDDEAKYININSLDSTLTICQNIEGKISGGGTWFNTIFEAANKAYDRIIILSDMQGWNEKETTGAYNAYKEKFNCNPILFSFDLAGYGTTQFPQENIYCINGYSEKMLELMKKLEEDKQAILKEIESIII